MKMAFDVHGTLDKATSFFKKHMMLLKQSGIEVIIISGPPTVQIRSELDYLGITLGVHYDRILSVADFVREEGYKWWTDKDGNFWCDNTIWWKTKAQICERHEIYSLVDDKEEYQKYFNITKCKFIKWPMKYQREFIAYFDGSSKGNPGLARIGYIIIDQDGNEFQGSETVGDNETNNFAEWKALYKVLVELIVMDATKAIIKGDSNLVVNQINGNWKCKHKNLIPLYNECKSLLDQIPDLTIQWIPREENKADSLAQHGG